MNLPRRFFSSQLPDVQAFQDELNSNTPSAQQQTLPEPPYDPDCVTVTSKSDRMNRLITDLRTAASSKIIGFDLEWKPLYQMGMGGGDKVAVMQISYLAHNGTKLCVDLPIIPPEQASRPS